LDRRPFGIFRLAAPDRNSQVNVRVDVLLVAVGGYDREVVFSKPFAVKPRGKLEEEMAAVSRLRVDRLNPLRKLFSAQLVLQKLANL
jgi:hypothetical protein